MYAQQEPPRNWNRGSVFYTSTQTNVKLVTMKGDNLLCLKSLQQTHLGHVLELSFMSQSIGIDLF